MNTASEELIIDPELLRQFDRPGPRYTSYPTADRFVEAFGAEAYRLALEKRVIGGFSRALALYVHLPFCGTICYYCGCNKVVTRDHGRSAKYLRYLAKEINLVGAALGKKEDVAQLHLGGGTPTFLSDAELGQLMDSIRNQFNLPAESELSIEVDPRTVSPERMATLARLGFNRLSVGVQDLNIEVQRAINRIQSAEQTASVIESARRCGFKSVNVDLIYGLPRQRLANFSSSLERVIEMAPDRIALYSYAHLPAVFKPQRRINEADLPDAPTRIDLMIHAIRTLSEAGYVYIGMDHFARPDDDLAVAQRLGRLQRNFQGYSTQAEADLIGLGLSAIGNIGPAYSQNYRDLDDYYGALDNGVFPVMRGIEMTPDDLVRRAVIHALMCQFEVSFSAIEIAYLINFRQYFGRELEDLSRFEREGLVEVDDASIIVTPRGRLLVRAVCMLFDQYLRSSEQRARYSKVI